MFSHIDCVAGGDQYRKKGSPLHFLIGLKEKFMKSDIGRWMVVVFMSFLMSGCSSIRARTETSDKDWTVYPGIQQDIKDTGRLFGGKSSDPGWAKGLVTTILIVDLPLTIAFDTIVVPYDLYRIYTPKHSREKTESHQESPQRDMVR